MDDLLFMISNRDINIPDFTELVINDNPARDFIINQLVTNKDISIYYNCYLIIAPASEKHPELFYEYRDKISGLFESNISYHRNIAMEISANMAPVDTEGYIEKVYDKYFSHLDHKSLVTKRYCVKNSVKIALAKPKLRGRIIKLLLSIDIAKEKNTRQMALLNSDIIEVLGKLYPDLKNKKPVHEFIRSEINSSSPRAKKMAREFMKKYPG